MRPELTVLVVTVNEMIRSGLTRAFDFSRRSNRFVLLATPGLGAAAGVVTLVAGKGWGRAFANGFAAGGAAFLAWAVAREFHPDRPAVATVAATVAPLGVVLADPDLLAAGTILLVSRVVAGTTGRGLRWFDVALITAVAAPVAWRATGPGILTTSAVALGVVALGQARWRLETGMTAVILAGCGVLAWSRLDLAFDPEPWQLAVAGLGLFALLGPRSVTVGTDRAGGTILPRRVRLGRTYAWVSAAAAALWMDPGAVLPVWSALAVTGLRPR